MTEEQCSKCKHASSLKFYEGEDMFTCDMEDDPNMPFDMDYDTFCPCFEAIEEDEEEEDE